MEEIFDDVKTPFRSTVGNIKFLNEENFTPSNQSVIYIICTN